MFKLRLLCSCALVFCLSVLSLFVSLIRPANAEPLPPSAQQESSTAQKPSGLLVDPSFYQATLPPLGEATTYLPEQATYLPIRLVVKLSKRRVYVYKGKAAVASYPIAVGKPGWETPLGDYQVFNMEKNPIFKSFKSGRIVNPGPENPLGVRWIGIWTDGKTQLGFHGTNEPELIGQAVSHGCMRMHNKDVMALFEQVAIGTPVKVEP
jgi:lipoprotein-anchoring transpeptidase ErfK/SrfK